VVEVAVEAAAALYSGVVDIILILYCFATHRAARHNLHADVGRGIMLVATPDLYVII